MRKVSSYGGRKRRVRRRVVRRRGGSILGSIWKGVKKVAPVVAKEAWSLGKPLIQQALASKFGGPAKAGGKRRRIMAIMKMLRAMKKRRLRVVRRRRGVRRATSLRRRRGGRHVSSYGGRKMRGISVYGGIVARRPRRPLMFAGLGKRRRAVRMLC